MPSWGSLGVLLEHSWRPLGALLGGFGALLRLFLGDLGGLLGLFWEVLEPSSWSLWLKKGGSLNSCPPLGGSKVPSWGFAGSLQGLCRGGTLQRPCKDPAKLESWRPLRAVLGRIDQKEGRRQFLSPPRRLKNAVLGPSWPALGALLGALGAVLGPSWTPLRAVLGRIDQKEGRR